MVIGLPLSGGARQASAREVVLAKRDTNLESCAHDDATRPDDGIIGRRQL